MRCHFSIQRTKANFKPECNPDFKRSNRNPLGRAAFAEWESSAALLLNRSRLPDSFLYDLIEVLSELDSRARGRTSAAWLHLFHFLPISHPSIHPSIKPILKFSPQDYRFQNFLDGDWVAVILTVSETVHSFTWFKSLTYLFFLMFVVFPAILVLYASQKTSSDFLLQPCLH